MRSKLTGLGGWLKNSLIDYPGTVSTVLFFSGCNLRCPYCHNGFLVERTIDESLRSDEVWEFLDARRGLIEGIVLSGGEPTLHAHLRETIGEMRNMGYRIKLDTNGLLPDVAEAFAPDYLALDIKSVPGNYASLLGASCKDVAGRLERSLGMVRRLGENAEVRITVAPGIVTPGIARQLRGLLRGIGKVFLQPMNQTVELLDPAFNDLAPVSEGDLEEIRSILAEVVGNCCIRGRSD